MKIDVRENVQDDDPEFLEVRFSDQDVINVDKSSRVITFEEEDGNDFQVYVEDINNLIKALEKAKDFLAGKL